MNHVSSRLFAVVVAGYLASFASAAPLPKADPRPKDMPQADYIRKVLDSKANLEFTGITLTGAVSQLSEDFGITFSLDKNAVQQMGMEPTELQVEAKLKGVKLRDGLRTMMAQYGLSFAVVGDTVLITTEEMGIYRQLNQRVTIDYDNIPLSKAVKELAGTSGVNLVIDPRAVKNKTADVAITLKLDDAPVEAVVRLMCEMGDMKPVRLGNIVFVTTPERAEKLKDPNGLMPNPMFNPGGIANQILPAVIGGIGIAPNAVPEVEAPVPPMP